MRVPVSPLPARPLQALHGRFLSLVPRIRLHGCVYFRHVRSTFTKEELLAEMVAICWKWFVRLVQRGKDPLAFPSALASYAARAVRSGRRLVRQERARDVLSPVAQQRHGFLVSRLPYVETEFVNPLLEALIDNTVSPVLDQVAFRLDFPAWLLTQSERDRRLIEGMLLGRRTSELARQHGLSPARVSQKRREFHQDWERFTADPAERQP
jgi:hypothetical protein